MNHIISQVIIDTPDFSQEHRQISVNGFPIAFRFTELSNGAKLWVPRGISRGPFDKNWRIYFTHCEGVFEHTVSDEGNALKALTRAWGVMTHAMGQLASTLYRDRRPRHPGARRDPLTDTGVTGVVVHRSVKEGRKTIVVICDQIPEGQAVGKVASRQLYVGGVSEKVFFDDPYSKQADFERWVAKGVAVRRYYNKLCSEAARPEDLIRYEDVPQSVRKQPYDMPEIQLRDLFESYVATFDPLTVAPRQSTEEAAIELQGLDLRQKQRRHELNGHFIRFRETEAEGSRLFLPTGLFRWRGSWRIRFQHAGGTFEHKVVDEPGQQHPEETLSETWLYLISKYCELEAPTEKPANLGEDLLNTGLENVSFLVGNRSTAGTDVLTWTFQLRYRQQGPEGQTLMQTLGYWTQFTINNDELKSALLKAAATVNYRRHLQYQADFDHAPLIKNNIGIPDQFWPTQPVVSLTVDDLFVYAEQRSGETVSLKSPQTRILTGEKGVRVAVTGRSRKSTDIPRWLVSIAVQNPWYVKSNMTVKSHYTFVSSHIDALTDKWFREQMVLAIAFKRYLFHLYDNGYDYPGELGVADVPPEFRCITASQIPGLDDVMRVVVFRSKKKGWVIPPVALPWNVT